MRVETIIFDREVPQCPRSVAVSMTVAEVDALCAIFPALGGCVEPADVDNELDDSDTLFLVLSIAEAAALANHCNLSALKAGKAYPVTSAAWDLLDSMVFKAYWSDGLDGYERGERE